MIKISDKFEPLYKEQTRYYIITGDRGSSKSFSVSDYLVRKTYQPKQIIYFTRFTLDSAKDSVIPELKEKLELLNCESDFDINRLDVNNKLSGSELKFRGIKASQGSQTAKLKGLTGCTVWVIDEAEEFTDEDLFNKLDKSLRVKGQKNIIIFILNPTYKKHFIYQRFFKAVGVDEHFNGIKDNVTYINVSWEDNRENLDEDFIKDAEKLRFENPKKYRKVYSSGWLDPDEGLLLPELKTGIYKPTEQPIRVAYIDTADGGGDFYAMPIIEVQKDRAFLIDVIYNHNRITTNEPLTVAMLNKYNVDTVIIETNKEGGLYVGNIQTQTKCKVIGIRNSIKKETRMLNQSGYIMEKMLILPYEKQSEEYRRFITDCMDYEIEGKDQHDDAPDSLAGLFKYLQVSLKL